MKKRVADIIMETLVEEGITTCFAVVGGGAMHLDNALALNNNIKKYFNHHEQACAMAAEAYARVSGKMAAVCVTSGPGATNTITGVVGAWQDSLPMIVLSGQVRYEISIEKSKLPLRYRGIQEFEIIPTVRNMTKYAIMITDPLEIKRELKKGIRIALDGRRGPVWFDIPLDIQSRIVEEDDLYPIDDFVKNYNVAVDNIKYIQNELRTAKRPCILAGSGIISGDVRKEFEKFIKLIRIPIIGGAWNADIFYYDYPLFYGLSGNIGPRTGNFILQNADLILVLGSSLSFRQTGFNQEVFAQYAKIIMIDADEYEAQKPGLHIDKFIHTDLRTFFEDYSNYAIKIDAKDDWINYCNHLKLRFNRYEAIEGLDMSERVCSYYFWKKFEELAPEDVVVALGNNSANSAKLQVGVKKKNQRVITNYTCGSMGYDLPAAIGTTIATGKTVYCITGDGSIMMNIQELQTIKKYDLPIKIVVFSNDGYNAIRQTCKNFFEGTYIGCTADSGVSFPEFSEIAQTFGFDYKCCEENSKVEENLHWLFNLENRGLLEIKQRLDDPVTPKVMSRMNEDGTFSTPYLQDMAPFLEPKEYHELMISLY